MDSVWLSSFALLAMVLSTSCSDGTRGDLLRTVPDAGQSRPVSVAKLIEVGHDAPTGITGLDSLRSRASGFGASPFDGMVVDVGLRAAVFSAVPIVEAELSPAVTALQQIPFGKLTDNFQWINVDPGGFDWFDDAALAAVRSNAALAAAVVKRGGLRGMFFDTQPYLRPIWSLADQPPTKTFQEYQAEVTQRGHEVGVAMFDAYPQITILLNLAYSELFRSVCLAGNALQGEPYALLPSFLDGLVGAAAEHGAEGQIIDGFIGAYPTLDVSSFELFFHLIHYDWGGVVAKWKPGVLSHRYPAGIVHWNNSPVRTCDDATVARLARDLPAGFGIMMDYSPGQGRSFAPAGDLTGNYFQPEALTSSVRAAIARADRYVWLWNESVDWWGGTTGPAVPDTYLNAVLRSRTE